MPPINAYNNGDRHRAGYGPGALGDSGSSGGPYPPPGADPEYGSYPPDTGSATGMYGRPGAAEDDDACPPAGWGRALYAPAAEAAAHGPHPGPSGGGLPG